MTQDDSREDVRVTDSRRLVNVFQGTCKTRRDVSSGSRDRVNAAGQGYSLELLRSVGVFSDVRYPAGRGISALVAGYVRGMRECTLVPDRKVLASGAIIQRPVEPLLLSTYLLN